MPEVNQPGAAMMGEAPHNACKRTRNFVFSALASLAVTLAAIRAGPSSARAQETTLPYGMQLFVTPYLWLAVLTPRRRRHCSDCPRSIRAWDPFSCSATSTGRPSRDVAIDHHNGIFAGTNDAITTIGGRPPMTLEEFVEKHRAAFV
jgi:hypothetical protein